VKFLIDASSDARHVGHLRSLDHDVTRVGTDYPANMKDVDILALAYREQRILITDDRDFGELVFRLRQPHTGVIYLRLDTTRFEVRARRVEDVLASHADHLDEFLVVTADSIRVRRKTDL
jgi:predicted nuclease of predicted toxin-antitoxin system